MYSVTQAAEKLGKGISTVRKWCKELDCPKVGTQYVIDEKFLKKLKKTIRDNVGRPWPEK